MTTEIPSEHRAGHATARERSEAAAQEAVSSLDVWARSAPIRLAGYEDDPAESHILRGID